MSVPILIPLPTFILLPFIYVGCVLFNNGMTTLSCVTVEELFHHWAVVVVVALELGLPP